MIEHFYQQNEDVLKHFIVEEKRKRSNKKTFKVIFMKYLFSIENIIKIFKGNKTNS